MRIERRGLAPTDMETHTVAPQPKSTTPDQHSSADGTPFAYGIPRSLDWRSRIDKDSPLAIDPNQPVEYAVVWRTFNLKPGPSSQTKARTSDEKEGKSPLPSALRFPSMLMETRVPNRIPMPLEEAIVRAQRGIDEALPDISDDAREDFLADHRLLLLALVPSERVRAVELKGGRLAEVPLPTPDALWELAQPWENELRPISLMSGIPGGLTSEEALAYLHIASGDTEFTDEWYAQTWAEVRELLHAGTIGVPDVMATAVCTIVADGRDRPGECRAFHELVTRQLAEPHWADMEVDLVSSLHRTARPGPRDTVRDALAWIAPLTELMAEPPYYEILWNTIEAEAEMMGIHDPYEFEHANWRQARAVIRALDAGDVDAVRQALDAYEREASWSDRGDGWAERPKDPKSPDAPLDWLLTREAADKREGMPEGPVLPDNWNTLGMPPSLWFPEALDRHLPDGDDLPSQGDLERALAGAQRDIDEGLETADEVVRRRYMASRARLRVVVSDGSLQLVTLEKGQLRLADTEDARQTLDACRAFGLLPPDEPNEPDQITTGQEAMAYCHLLSTHMRRGKRAERIRAGLWPPVAALMRSGQIGAADVFATRGGSLEMAGRDRAAECLAFHRLVKERGLEFEQAIDIVEVIVALHLHVAEEHYPLVDEALAWAGLITKANEHYNATLAYAQLAAECIDQYRPLPPMDGPEPAPDDPRPSYFAVYARAALDALAAGDFSALERALLDWRDVFSPLSVARYMRDPDQQAEIDARVAEQEQETKDTPDEGDKTASQSEADDEGKGTAPSQR